jgi:hypothetical protein
MIKRVTAEQVANQKAYGAAVAARSRDRRVDLGKTCRELAASVPGLSLARVKQWEHSFGMRYRPEEQLLEQALQVPPGWLRDLSMATPPVVRQVASISKEDLSLANISPGTVASEITALCVYALCGRRTALNDLLPMKRRLTLVMACRVGIFGAQASNLAFVQSHFDRTSGAIAHVTFRVREALNLEAKDLSLPALNKLAGAIEQYLPCSVKKLDVLMRDSVGVALSIADADKFALEFLKGSPLRIVHAEGGPIALPASLCEQDVGAVRDAVLSSIRATGAAHIERVPAIVHANGRTDLEVATIAAICEALGDFAWLDEESGWFWLGPGFKSVVGAMALLVTAAAGRRVHVDDIRRAVKRAAPAQPADLPRPPTAVLRRVLSACPGIETAGEDFYTLAAPVSVQSLLTPTDFAIFFALEKRGGTATLDQLQDDVVATGRMQRSALMSGLSTSPIFVAVADEVWGIRGVVQDQSFIVKGLSSAKAASLGARAARRREHLGKTLLDIAERIGISANQLVRLESCLPSMRDPFEVAWERALEVPDGWLRDSVLGDDVQLTSTVPPLVAGFAPGTVVFEIGCLLHQAAGLAEGIAPDRAMRDAEMVAMQCGLFGHFPSRTKTVATRYGTSAHSIASARVRMAETIRAAGTPTPALDSLIELCHANLPMRLEDFEASYRSLIGEKISVIDLGKVCATLLGRDLFAVVTAPSGKLVTPAIRPMSVLIALRAIVGDIVRTTGGAQLHWVAGELSKTLDRALAVSQVRRWCELLDGFEWLAEDLGWFWLGPEYGPQLSATKTFIKVLSVAPGAVALSDILGALARLRTRNAGLKMANASYIEAPLAVVRAILSRLPEVVCDGGDMYRLLVRPDQSSLESLLTNVELSAYQILLDNGGVASSAALGAAMRASGYGIQTQHLAAVSVFLEGIGRGLHRMRGFPLDPVRYRKSVGECPRSPKGRPRLVADHAVDVVPSLASDQTTIAGVKDGK